MVGYAPYFVLLLVLVFFACAPISGNEREENIKLAIVVVMFTLIAGLRATTVGTDTEAYSRMFYRIADSKSLFEAFEVSTIKAPVYVGYAWVLGKLGFSHQMLLLANAGIIYGAICVFVKRTCKRPIVAFLLFYCFAMFFQSLNGMRQYLAVALGINAYYYFSQYGIRDIKAWVLFALAVGTHTTAAFLVPGIALTCAMRMSRRSSRVLSGVLIVALIFGLLLEPLVNVFMKIVPYYSMYDGVTNVGVFASTSRGRIRILYAVVLAFCFLGYWLFVRQDDGECRDDNKTLDIVFALFPLCSIASILGLIYGASSLINRLLWFYMVAFISFIPAVIDGYQGGTKKIIKIVAIAVFAVWVFAQLAENQDEMIPYVLGSGLFTI